MQFSGKSTNYVKMGSVVHLMTKVSNSVAIPIAHRPVNTCICLVKNFFCAFLFTTLLLGILSKVLFKCLVSFIMPILLNCKFLCHLLTYRLVISSNHIVLSICSVKVFRCQLSRTNAFYSSEPPKYDGADRPLSIGGILECLFFLNFLLGLY